MFCFEPVEAFELSQSDLANQRRAEPTRADHDFYRVNVGLSY